MQLFVRSESLHPRRGAALAFNVKLCAAREWRSENRDEFSAAKLKHLSLSGPARERESAREGVGKGWSPCWMLATGCTKIDYSARERERTPPKREREGCWSCVPAKKQKNTSQASRYSSSQIKWANKMRIWLGALLWERKRAPREKREKVFLLFLSRQLPRLFSPKKPFAMINKIVSCVGRVVCDLNTRDKPRALAAKNTRKSEKVALEKAKMRYESSGIF